MQSFFFKQHALFTLVFDMRQLLNPDSREECLNVFLSWLNKIMAYTASNDQVDSMASVLIVGTHKDIVRDPREHAELSTILYNALRHHRAFAFVVQNKMGLSHLGHTDMLFFPIDNTQSGLDPMVEHLRSAIQAEAKKAPHMNELMPLSWMKLLDVLQASASPVLPYAEVEEIARQCQVSSAELVPFLAYMNSVSQLMWFDEDNLKDQIILKPIEGFVLPASAFIRRFSPDATHVMQMTPMHADIQKSALYREDFTKMVDTGFVSVPLAQKLLSGCNDKFEMVIALMFKYSLMVPIYRVCDTEEEEEKASAAAQAQGTATSRSYMDDLETLFVPALLSTELPADLDFLQGWWYIEYLLPAKCGFVDC